MNRFHLKSNPQSAGAANQPESLLQIRTRVLNIIIPFSTLLGAALLISRMPQLLGADSWVNIAVYVTGILGLLLATLLPQIPYRMRVYGLLVVIALVGIVTLAQSGFSGSGLLFLIVLTPLAMILLGVRQTALVSILTLVILIIMAVMIGVRILPVPPLENQISSGSTRDWISTIVIFTIISAVLAIATRFLFEGLENTAVAEQKSSEELRRQHMILEQNVAGRTRDLQHYISRMRTAGDISKAITSNLDPQQLLDQVVDLLQQKFDLYYTGVFLADASHQNAILYAGSGEAGKIMLAQNHRLSIEGSSMIGWAIKNRQARITLDADRDIIRYKNPTLPQTRSEMALPLISRDQVIGALSLQSSEPNAFSEEDITILQYIADVLAAALENAQSYEKAQTSLRQANLSNRHLIEQTWGDVLQSSGNLESTFDNGNASSVSSQINTIRIPLTLRDQELGFIDLDIDRETLSDDEYSFIGALASQTAQAMENARLLQESERQVGREQLINRMSARFTSSSEVESILIAAAEELGRLPLVQEASIFIKPQSELVTLAENLPNGNNGHGKK